MAWKFLWAALLLGASIPAPSQKTAKRSLITIHVGKTGFFSGLAHNHTVIAPVEQVSIDASHLSAEIVVMTKQMKVADSEASESDRSEMQSTMLGPKVLDADKYPEIHFRSERIEPAVQSYRVIGTLNLHGVAKEITFDVSGTPDHYYGKAKLNQTDFGISPISIAGGTVKVKDKLDLEFDVYPKSLRMPTSVEASAGPRCNFHPPL